MRPIVPAVSAALAATIVFTPSATAMHPIHDPDTRPSRGAPTAVADRVSRTALVSRSTFRAVMLRIVTAEAYHQPAPRVAAKPSAPAAPGTKPKPVAPAPEPVEAKPETKPKAKPKTNSSAAAAPAAPVTVTPPAPGTARSIAASAVAARGWGSDQFGCLDKLWTKESGWNVTASNPSSGAYGIPQSLPGSKMAAAGANWRTDAATQIRWGLTYIAGQYGTPCAAWAHSVAVNWY